MRLENNNERSEEIRKIYKQHFQDVYRFISSFLTDTNDIEDLTQEVFIRLFKSLANFKGQSELKTWIFSIARHVTYDHMKKQKKQKIIRDHLLKFILPAKESIEEIIMIKEQNTVLYESLSCLKVDHRTVVILRGIHQLSIQETAKVLGWKESKVKVTYHRALQILKKNLINDKELKEGMI